MNIIWIAGLGAVGVLARHFLDTAIGQPGGIPLSTFLINVTGSFAIGFLFVAGSEGGLLSKEFAGALGVGLLGGFTTFSAFSLQTFQLFERGQHALALAYAAGSPLLGVLAAGAGVYLAQAL